MRLGISERQRRAPGAAEDHPFFDADHVAKPLDVGDKVPGGVGLEVGMRRRAYAAALVEQDDVVESRVKQSPLAGIDADARSAVEEYGRLGASGAGEIGRALCWEGGGRYV